MMYNVLIKWGIHPNNQEYLQVNAKSRSDAYDQAMTHIETNYSDMLQQYAVIMDITKESIVNE